MVLTKQDSMLHVHCAYEGVHAETNLIGYIHEIIHVMVITFPKVRFNVVLIINL